MCARRRVILSGGGPSAAVSSESLSFLSFFLRRNLSHLRLFRDFPIPTPPTPEPSAS